MFYTLTNDYISDHYNEFHCSYGDNDYSTIISFEGFNPETFMVSQKQQGQDLLFFNDVSYRDWCINIIVDACKNTIFDLVGDREEFVKIVLSNLETLLAFSQKNSEIANQEFVDVIRRVVCFTLFGNVQLDIDMSKPFNDLARKMMPIVIEELRTKDLPISDLLILSILSGLSGLDLKGAPAAASAYMNEGIPMCSYLDMDVSACAQKYLSSIYSVYSSCKLGIFHIEQFYSMLSNYKELVWMTDDLIESYFDLLIIERILLEYEINITIIPKSGFYGNDLSYSDLMSMMDLPCFSRLIQFKNNGKLKISSSGPKMGAANIRKFSSDVINILSKADAIYMKGCRIHEMLQGGINRRTYSSFVVVRQLTEITSGFSSAIPTVLFFCLEPQEYSFWGVNVKDIHSYSKESHTIPHSITTIKDHFERKQPRTIEEDIDDFNELYELLSCYSGCKTPLLQELNILANKLIEATCKQYNDIGSIYAFAESQREESKQNDHLWKYLLDYVDAELLRNKKLTLLDIGTATGSGLEYALNLGFKAFGVDNSAYFIEELNKKSQLGLIPSDSFALADMRSIPLPSESFDVVRMSASLLHLPLIEKGYSADLAICEAYRLLRPNGILFVSVKAGHGIKELDTHEGLGKRIYQLYTHSELSNLLERNGFTIINRREYIENRNGSPIEWIVQIAKRK